MSPPWNERPKPYVGVAGVVSPEEAIAVAKSYEATFRPFARHKLAIGILTSAKVLSGGERNARTPKPVDVPAIVDAAGEAPLSFVHFFTREPTGLCAQLQFALDHGGPLCSGVQINAPFWPDPGELARFGTYGDTPPQLIVQIGPRMLAGCAFPSDVRRRLGPIVESYPRGYLRILLDGSAGTGRPIDVAAGVAVLADLADAFPALGLGVAGGLGPGQIESLKALAYHFPDLSIDAETALRTPVHGRDDVLDWGKVAAYLYETAALFGESR